MYAFALSGSLPCDIDIINKAELATAQYFYQFTRLGAARTSVVLLPISLALDKPQQQDIGLQNICSSLKQDLLTVVPY